METKRAGDNGSYVIILKKQTLEDLAVRYEDREQNSVNSESSEESTRADDTELTEDLPI